MSQYIEIDNNYGAPCNKDQKDNDKKYEKGENNKDENNKDRKDERGKKGEIENVNWLLVSYFNIEN